MGSSGHFGRLIPLEGSDHWEVEGSNHWEVHTIGKFRPLGSSDHWDVQIIEMVGLLGYPCGYLCASLQNGRSDFIFCVGIL